MPLLRAAGATVSRRLAFAIALSMTAATLLAQPAPETVSFQSIVPNTTTRSTSVAITAKTTANAGKVILTSDGHYLAQGVFNNAGIAPITTNQLPSGRSIIKLTYVGSALFQPSSTYTTYITRPSGTTLGFNQSQITGGFDGFHPYAADVNLDGRTDIVEANINGAGISVLLGNGDGTFQAPTFYPTGSATSSPRGIAIADFNGDGLPDLAVANGDNTASLLLNNGNGTFAAQTIIYTGGAMSLIEDIAAYDLDGDGKMDLCIVDEFGGQALVLFGNGDGTFVAPIVAISGAPQPFRVVGGQFTNGVGDFAVADPSAGTITFLASTAGRVITSPRGASPLTPGPGPVVAADFNSDGYTDLVVLSPTGLQFFPGTGNANGPFTTFAPISLGALNNGIDIAAGDFNGDGNLDVVVIGNGASSGLVQVFTGDGAGNFSAGVAFAVALNPNGVTAGDFNGDGRDDIAGGELGASPIDLFLAYGPPASINPSFGNNQHAAVATSFSAPLQAVFKDSSGNPVPGIAATFTAPASGPSGTFPSGAPSVVAVTNAQGIATAPAFTANHAAGSYAISVGFTTPALGFTTPAPGFTTPAPGFTTPGVFSLTNDPGPVNSLSIVSGSAQTANLSAAFSLPLSVAARDAFSNPVPGTIVTFTSPASGAGGTFSGPVTSVTATANASGIAATPVFTANGIAGAYQVNATAAGVGTPAVFTLANTGGLVTSAPPNVAFSLTQPATTLPASKTLSLTGPGAVMFTLAASTSSGGNWLSATPSSGTTPTTAFVSLLPAALQLAPGAYNGSITIQSATNQTVVPVILMVLAPFDPLPNRLSFVAGGGSSTQPLVQTFSLSSSNRPLPFSITVPGSAPWLTAMPADGTTAATITVSVNPMNLAPGSYSAGVTISSPFATPGSVMLPVSVQVQAVIAASPNALAFAAFLGQNPAQPQSISIGGASGIAFSAQASDPWILVSPASGVTPSSLSVTVNPTGLSAGSYFGSISVSGTGATNLAIPVSVTIQPALNVVTGSGNGAVFLMPTATPGIFAADTTIVTNTTGSSFIATVSGQGLSTSPVSGTLPTVLHTSVDASKFAPGTYQGTITLNIPDANPPTRTLAVSYTVNPPQPAQVMTQAPGLTFSLSSAVPKASRQALASNLGSGVINFTASANQPWIQVSPPTGVTTSLGAAPIAIDLDLTGFAAGTYHGAITVASASNSITIPVNVSVSALQTGIALSQTGLTFNAVAGAAAPPPQSFLVLDTGTVPFGFQVSTSTTSGGSSWLSATPALGSTDEAPVVQVTVNTTGLAAGTYYGQVQVFSAANPEQSVTVVLNLAAAGTLIRPPVAPSGLIFAAAANGSNPAAQTITIQNPTASTIQFVSTPIYGGGVNWFSYDPPLGQIAPGQTQTITIAPTPVSITRALAAGVYRAQLNLGFVGYESVQPIDLLLVVTPQAGVAAGKAHATTPACTPTKLLPVFTMLGSSFSVSAGFPAAIEIRVVDDCANSIPAGSVVTTFSNSDPPLSLNSLSDGRWAATWVPRNPTANATITGSAALDLSSTVQLTGMVQIMGNAQANLQTPIVASGGVVNAASFAKDSPIPPGALISIFGSQLADQQSSASSLPLPSQLGTTSASIDGVNVPLLYSSSGQVNGVVPFALQQNVTHLLLVAKGTALSVPQPVTIASAQPAVFTVDGSGSGQGVVLGFLNGGAQVLADSTHPVSAGGYIVMYATGLGAVTPPVPDGVAGPSSPLSTVNGPISLTIGGVNATITYAGLAPGFASLYQVNAIVPAVAPGNSVPLVITVAGQDSPPVTIAVK